MDPLELVPEQLIPRGTTRYQTSAGPSRLLMKQHGEVTAVRDADAIIVDSPRHGRMTISSGEGALIEIVLPQGRVYTCTPKSVSGGVELAVTGGGRVLLVRAGARIEVTLHGFGLIADRLRVHLEPQP